MDAQRAATETTTILLQKDEEEEAMLLFRGLLDEKQISQHFPILNFINSCFIQLS